MKHSAKVKAAATAHKASAGWTTLDVDSQSLSEPSAASVGLSSSSAIQARRLRQSLNRASEAHSQRQMAGVMFFVGGISTAIATGSIASIAHQASTDTLPETNDLDGAQQTALPSDNSLQTAELQNDTVVFPPVSLSDGPSPVRFSSASAIPATAVSQRAPISNPALLTDTQVEVGQRLNTVELKLLGLQRHLALNVYEISFIDQLLEQDSRYQNQLQDLKAIDAEIALEMTNRTVDQARLSQLKQQFYRQNARLQQKAQAILAHHLTVSQSSISSDTLQQEPLYQRLLAQLTDYTHEHKVLLARQENVEIAIAATPLRAQYAYN